MVGERRRRFSREEVGILVDDEEEPQKEREKWKMNVMS